MTTFDIKKPAAPKLQKLPRAKGSSDNPRIAGECLRGGAGSVTLSAWFASNREQESCAAAILEMQQHSDY